MNIGPGLHVGAGKVTPGSAILLIQKNSVDHCSTGLEGCDWSIVDQPATIGHGSSNAMPDVHGGEPELKLKSPKPA